MLENEKLNVVKNKESLCALKIVHYFLLKTCTNRYIHLQVQLQNETLGEVQIVCVLLVDM